MNAHSIKKLNNKGFSLAELMVALGLGVFMLSAVLSLNVLAKESFTIGTAFMDIHGSARKTMDWMTKDIRWAEQVVSSHTIGAQTYTTGDSEIILQVPSIDGSGDVITTSDDYIIYHVNSSDSTQLERIVDADSASSRSDETKILINDLNSLNFSSSGTGLSSVSDVTSLTNVEVGFSTSKTPAQGKSVSESLNSVVELRNK